MKKKRIGIIFPKDSEAFFVKDSSEPFGGASVQMFSIAKELVKKNNVESISFVPAYENMDPEILEKLHVCNMYKRGDLFFRRALSFFRTVIFKPGADIIIQHGLTRPSCILALFSAVTGRKFVFMFASDVEVRGRFQSSNRRCYLFPLILRYAVLVTQNAYQQKFIAEKYGIKSFIYYSGFDFSHIEETPKKPYILWVSRADKMKQPGLFVSLARDIPEYNFVMICPNIGRDREYAELKREVSLLDNLEIIEFVPFNDIQKYFNEACLFVNTSTYEGFPQTFVQAVIGSTPVLSLNVDPDGFISKYRCGVVCNNDYNLLKQSIIDLTNNSGRYNDLKENIKNYGMKYHKVSLNVEALYNYICNGILNGNCSSNIKAAILFPKDSEAVFNIRSKRTFGGATIHLYHFVKQLFYYDITPYTIIPAYEHIEFSDSDYFNLIKLYKESDNFLVKFFKFTRFLKKEKPEIVMQIGLTIESCILSLFCSMVKRKFVFFFASDVESAGYYQNSKKRCHLYKMLLRFSDLLIVQNDLQKETVKGINPRFESKVKVLKKGIDFTKLKKAESKVFDAVWIARCEKLKNIEACIKLAVMNPDKKFLIISPPAPGKEDYYNEVVLKINEVENIKFFPFTSQEETYKYIAASKCMILTSEYEGDWPLTVLEAVSSGVPVISLSLNYGKLIDEYKAGFFCNNQIVLADKCFKQLSSDDKLLAEMSQNAVRYSRDFHDIKKNTAQLFEFLSDLCH